MLEAFEFDFLLEWLRFIFRCDIGEIWIVYGNLHIWVLLGEMIFNHPWATRYVSVGKDEGRVEINGIAIMLVNNALEDSYNFFGLIGRPFDDIRFFFFEELSSVLNSDD